MTTTRALIEAKLREFLPDLYAESGCDAEEYEEDVALYADRIAAAIAEHQKADVETVRKWHSEVQELEPDEVTAALDRLAGGG